MITSTNCHIHFQQFNCYVDLHTTTQGNTITLKEHGTRESIVTITVLAPDKVSLNEVAIKNYGETQGVLRQMVEQGLITPPLRPLSEMESDIQICELVGDLKVF